MDREQEKLPTEFDDKTTSLFSEFMLRIAKFEELVDIAHQFLTGFCQELETFRRPQLYKTSKVVDHIIEANLTSRMKAYVEAGSRHRHHDIQNIVKLHSCMQGLQDHLMKVKVLLDELKCLKEDAIDIARKVKHNTTQLHTCDEEGLSLEASSLECRASSFRDAQAAHLQEDLVESMHLQDESTSYATLMAAIHNMLMLDYTMQVMQENIINSINWTAAKSEHLESYCLMWNLRPYINDNVMRQGWKLVSS